MTKRVLALFDVDGTLTAARKVRVIPRRACRASLASTRSRTGHSNSMHPPHRQTLRAEDRARHGGASEAPPQGKAGLAGGLPKRWAMLRQQHCS